MPAGSVAPSGANLPAPCFLPLLTGLCVVVASQRALAKLESRSTPIPAYYGSLKRWLPIMQVDTAS